MENIAFKLLNVFDVSSDVLLLSEAASTKFLANRKKEQFHLRPDELQVAICFCLDRGEASASLSLSSLLSNITSKGLLRQSDKLRKPLRCLTEAAALSADPCFQAQAVTVVLLANKVEPQ